MAKAAFLGQRGSLGRAVCGEQVAQVVDLMALLDGTGEGEMDEVGEACHTPDGSTQFVVWAGEMPIRADSEGGLKSRHPEPHRPHRSCK